MESRLAALERRIEDLLASVDLPGPNLLGGGGVRNGSGESDNAASEDNKLEKGEGASGNKVDKGSK